MANNAVRVLILVLVSQGGSLIHAQRVPVILVNGWQKLCGGSLSDSQHTFGNMERFLGGFGVPVSFFDNCVYGDLPIEDLADKLGERIRQLGVPQVDLVTHSMGGLIARSYLSGKRKASGVFTPPDDPKVRKLIQIATPNFGSFIAPNAGVQTPEMVTGSQFLWDLATWNQGRDDLREVDALAIIGNAGPYSTASHASDGVVSLTSGSLSFAMSDERTRIVPFCHTSSIFINCTGPSIASIDTPDHPTWKIVYSFLSGTSDWKTSGTTTPSGDQYLGVNGGLYFRLQDASEVAFTDVSQVIFGAARQQLVRGPNPSPVFAAEWLPKETGAFHVFLRGLDVPINNYSVTPGSYSTFNAKAGPGINRILPSAAIVSTLNLAPNSLISIFGDSLSSSIAQSSLPWPTRLGDVTVTANGQALGLLYVRPNQINAYLPPGLSGLVKITVTNSSGHDSKNVLMVPASPAIYSLDGSGTGPAAALHALTGQVVTSSNPATTGEYISLFVTGLGPTVRSGGLDITVITPDVAFPQALATVTYSGLAPGFPGLYQINLQVPEGAHGSPTMRIRSGKYISNAVTLAVQ